MYDEPVEQSEQPKEEQPRQEAQPAEGEPPPAEAPSKPARHVVRSRKKPPTKSTVAVPEIDDKFWASLLNTQRAAEKATRLQRISEFQLM